MALLGNLKGSANFFQSTAFYNGVVSNSVRMDGGTSVFTRTIGSSGGNRRKQTWAFWLKIGNTLAETTSLT